MVQAHLKNTYAKLGVSTRADTVERARLLGLLWPAPRRRFRALRVVQGKFPLGQREGIPHPGEARSPSREID